MPPRRSKFILGKHGNYCGAGWSGGKYQTSVKGKKGTAVDEYDETCRVHDSVYHDYYGRNNNKLNDADYAFYRANIGRGLERSTAALAVGLQGKVRSTFFPQKDSLNSDMSRKRSLFPDSPRGTPRSSNKRLRTALAVEAGMAAAKAVARGTQTSKAKTTSMGTQTARGGRKGYVAGKVGHLRKFKTPKRGVAKKSVTKMFQKCAREGHYAVHEIGVSVDPTTQITNAGYIGHSTYANTWYVQSFARALVKWLARQLKVRIVNWSDFSEFSPSGSGSQIYIRYRVQDDDSPQTLQVDADGITYDAIALALSTAFQQIYSGAPYDNPDEMQDVYFVDLSFKSDAYSVPTQRWDLSKMTCKFVVESVLKIQNTTPAYSATEQPDDDDAENIDAVPLQVYQFFGNGNFPRGAASSNTMPTDVYTGTGLIRFNGTNASKTLVAPLKIQFANVTSRKKSSFVPGEIRISKLSHIHGGKVNLNIRNWCIGDTLNNIPTRQGKFCMYSLEHVIKPTAEYAKIKIIGQLDYKIGSFVKIPQAQVSTTQVTDQLYYTI